MQPGRKRLDVCVQLSVAAACWMLVDAIRLALVDHGLAGDGLALQLSSLWRWRPACSRSFLSVEVGSALAAGGRAAPPTDPLPRPLPLPVTCS